MSSNLEIPEPVAFAAEFMSTYPRPWCLCGGWAVDAWLGRVTRSHGDLDITVFAEDQADFFAYLADWNMIAHDELEPMATEPWDGRPLQLPAHIHARPPGEENRRLVLSWVTPPYAGGKDGRDVELVINERRDNAWSLRDEPRQTIPLAAAIRESAWGVPTLAPQVIAYYKATAYFGNERLWKRAHDVVDFDALVALLSSADKGWLRDAIAEAIPDHPWLPKFTL